MNGPLPSRKQVIFGNMLFPGIGQFYARRYAAGVLFLLGETVCLFLTLRYLFVPVRRILRTFPEDLSLTVETGEWVRLAAAFAASVLVWILSVAEPFRAERKGEK